MDVKKLDRRFRGCVLVNIKGETILKKAYGYADLPNKKRNKTNTRFASASAGKVFVL